jgi:alanyl-tRNA synthetase
MSALDEVYRDRKLIRGVSQAIGATTQDLIQKVQKLQDKIKELQQKGRQLEKVDIKELRRELISHGNSFIIRPFSDAEMNVIFVNQPLEAELDKDKLGEIVDAVRGGEEKVVGFLSASCEDKTIAICFASKELGGAVQCGRILSEISASFGQKAGGRPDFAAATYKWTDRNNKDALHKHAETAFQARQSSMQKGSK